MNLFALGSYTSLGGPGIRVFTLDGDALSPLYDVWIKDPIWLEKSQDGRFLYGACGGEGPMEGFVAAFSPDGDFSRGMTEQARQEAHGVCPCHLCIAQSDLIAANYNSGSLSVFPLSEGLPLPLAQLIVRNGSGPHPRQVTSHMHQALPLPDGSFLAADLGGDAVVHYQKKQDEWVQVSSIPCPAGEGPRHVLARENVLYIATELQSHLLVIKDGSIAQRFDLPEPGKTAGNAPAAIRLCPDGNTIAVSSRGADQVSFFHIGPSGLLQRGPSAPVFGAGPRDILPLGHGRFLAANQNSGGVTLVERNGDSFRLLSRMPVPAPVALVRLS